MDVKIVNPIFDNQWDQKIPIDDETSIFYTRAWANALASSYGYKPLYFMLAENSKLRAFIPVMEVDSFLTGKRGVSLPFTDICCPIVGCKDDFHCLLNAILEYGTASDWKYFELRGGQQHLPNENPSEIYVEHHLDLTQSMEVIEKNFRGSFKRNIQKSIRKDVKIEITQSKRAYQHFIKLNFLTRKRHGLPPQPKLFFKNLYHFCIKENGIVFLATHCQHIIASAIFLTHRKHVIYKYGASDLNFQNLRPNNLLFYEAIRFFKQEGYHRLSLGRTDLSNTGLINFKNGLTRNTNTVHYNRYNFSRKKFVFVNNNYDKMNKLFNRMPIGLLNLTGKLLYRHMG